MRLFRIASITGLLIFSASLSHAAPVLLGNFGDWAAFSRYEGPRKICYVVSHAKTKAPTNVRHGDIHFLVANWKSGAATEQPSFMADFSLNKDRPPIVQIDGKNFQMYVSLNEGFIAERSDEVLLIDKMRAGSTMRIEAVSGRGTNVRYSFSLKGITAALESAANDCL